MVSRIVSRTNIGSRAKIPLGSPCVPNQIRRYNHSRFDLSEVPSEVIEEKCFITGSLAGVATTTTYAVTNVILETFESFPYYMYDISGIFIAAIPVVGLCATYSIGEQHVKFGKKFWEYICGYTAGTICTVISILVIIFLYCITRLPIDHYLERREKRRRELE